MILLPSSTGMPAPQIAAVVGTDESHERKVTPCVQRSWVRVVGAAVRCGSEPDYDVWAGPACRTSA
jgi:hypothetical protein